MPVTARRDCQKVSMARHDWEPNRSTISSRTARLIELPFHADMKTDTWISDQDSGSCGDHSDFELHAIVVLSAKSSSLGREFGTLFK